MYWLIYSSYEFYEVGTIYYVSNFADEGVESEKGQADCPVSATDRKGKKQEQ